MRYWLQLDEADQASFDAAAEQVSDLYRRAQEMLEQGVHVVCCDEKTGIQALEQVDSILQRVGDIVVAQDRMLNTAARSAELFQGSLGDLAKIHEHIDAVAVSLEEVHRTTADLHANILESTKEMTTAAASVKDTVATAGTAARDLHEALSDELAALTALGDSLRAEVEEVQSSLGTTMKEFAEDCQAGVRQTFSQFDEHLGTVSRTLSGTVAETNEQTREIGSVVAGIKQTVEEFDQSLTRALPALEGLATLASDRKEPRDEQGDRETSDPRRDGDGRVES